MHSIVICWLNCSIRFSSKYFKENIRKMFWVCLLLPVWNTVVNMGQKMIAVVVGWVGECCNELSTRNTIP